MAKILNFNLDRELGFSSSRTLTFNPNDGLNFSPDRELLFDFSRKLPFGERGILFRAVPCPACGTIVHHLEEECPTCHKTLNPIRLEKFVKEEQVEDFSVEKGPDKPSVETIAVPRQAPPRPGDRPGDSQRQMRGKGSVYCGECGVRVSPRHPYCWNCASEIKTAGQRTAPASQQSRPQSQPQSTRQPTRPSPFPAIVDCYACHARYRARKAGKFRCPTCRAVTLVGHNGRSTPVNGNRGYA